MERGLREALRLHQEQEAVRDQARAEIKVQLERDRADFGKRMDKIEASIEKIDASLSDVTKRAARWDWLVNGIRKVAMWFAAVGSAVLLFRSGLSELLEFIRNEN